MGLAMKDSALRGWECLRELVRSVCRCDETQPGCVGAEVGVSMGWTSEHLLREFSGLYLYLVDYWSSAAPDGDYAKSGDGHANLTYRQQEEHKTTAVRRTQFAADRRSVWQSDSVEAAGRIMDGALDFAFLDARHDYEGVKADLEAWAPKVRQGGLIILHDLDHRRDKRGLWGVRRAVEEFASKTGWELHVDSTATIGWMRVQ